MSRYGDDPFKPFWEKEKDLRNMSSAEAEREARNDSFLPFFSKEKFIPGFEFPWDDED